MPCASKHPDEAIAGVRSVLRVLVLFALVTPFWSLFDQKASTWVLQARRDDEAELVSIRRRCRRSIPLLVMLLIPFNNLVLYPALAAIRLRNDGAATDDRRHRLSGLSWIVVGAMQVVLDGGNAFSITWQVLPYALLTFGEVLVAATGLEFAYSQAPLAMKGAIMAFWNFSVTIGNLWVLVVNAGVQNSCRHELHQVDRLRRDGISDVFLRRVCLCRRPRFRSRRPHLSRRRSLSQRGDLTSCPLSHLLGGSLSPVRLQKSLMTNLSLEVLISVEDGASARTPVGKGENFRKAWLFHLQRLGRKL